MERGDADQAVRQLVTGFETLHEEYRALHEQHLALERKLAAAREQYNELSRLYGSNATATPPLSLASSVGRRQHDIFPSQTTLQILRTRDRQDAALKVEAGIKAAKAMRSSVPKRPDLGVRIWSGPSADRQEGGNSGLHSISESPLEQDFTIEGKPSQLGCPFASMANKKLSSHAASVLSRYQSGSAAASASQLGSDSVNRVNGKDSLIRRGSRRASFADPIKAEICGLSDHHDAGQPAVDREVQPAPEGQEEPGVCPIRFLDQHSPEEVATYFEAHKHELPRSHEVCVRRYQSNEQQIRELDEKYGNLVSMIQGLGKKHQDMLPLEPEGEDDAADDGCGLDEDDAEKVRQWASSISAQVGNEPATVDAVEAGEERQGHFDRPLRDIRVGESPSRPWGVSVPPRYLEKDGSQTSSRPVQVSSPPLDTAATQPGRADTTKGKCPLGFDQPAEAPKATARPLDPVTERPRPSCVEVDDNDPPVPTAHPQPPDDAKTGSPRMVFHGPVFFGYSAEDAAKLLKLGGFG